MPDIPKPVLEGFSVLKNRELLPTSDPLIKTHLGQPCVDTSAIVTGKDRGRQEFNEILSLAENIKALGLLCPIKLRRLDPPVDGKSYTLVAGERRFRAFALTGEKYIPFTLENESSKWAKLAELAENKEREPLTWKEELRLLSQIHELGVELYGEKAPGSPGEAPGPIERTAAIVKEDRSNVGKKIKFHNKMQARPDIAKMVENLPLSRAIKEFEKIEQSNDFLGKQANGTAAISTEIENCSCLDGILRLAPASVDCWITDPPYGHSGIASGEGKSWSTSKGKSMSYTGAMESTDNMDAESFKTLMTDVVKRMTLALKPGAHCYIFFTHEHYTFLVNLLRSSQFIVDDDPIIWDKGRQSHPPTGYAWVSSYEPILFAHFKEASRTLTNELRNVVTVPPVPVDSRLHNFQKPVELISKLIICSTKPGDLVLDTFAGSGAIVKTAKLLNRSAKGFEVSTKNFGAAQMNLAVPDATETSKGQIPHRSVA